MIPLPIYFVDQLTYLLQKGSTTVTCWLLQLVGVPLFRNGFVITMPTLKIVVAEECSSIRSSLALAITSLLAAHLFLKSMRDRMILVLLAFPVALIKNGIRIATLSLLSMFVDMSFMTGRLHHQGGFVFFAVALVIMYAVLRLLQRIEAHGSASATPTPAPLSPGTP
jgi:exosortase